MKTTLKGQAALVTGGNTGIGAAVSRALGAAGAKVAINYVSHSELAEDLAESIRANGNPAMIVKADVTSEDEVEQMFDTVLKEFGALDILVSNAGIEKNAALVDMSLDDWRSVIDVNLNGAFLCARQAARIFVKQGVTERSRAAGKIIFTSSVHEIIPWTGHSNYCASKGALRMFMKSLAQELAPHAIRVNNLGPGAIMTSINKQAWLNEDNRRRVLELIPQGRWGEPDDIAKAAVWLASDEADYVNGTTLYVDGGMLLYPSFEDNG